MQTLMLQLFLLVNVAAIGVLATLAIQHAREHYRPSAKPSADTPLPNDVKADIVQAARQQFHSVIDSSAAALQQDLASTNTQLNTMLEKLVTYAVNAEMERYRDSLDVLHRQNESTLRDSLRDTTQQHIDLKAKLIKRQAELDHELLEHQTTLERQLAEHQSDTEAKLNDRQAELDRELAERQARQRAEQADMESALTKHQTEVETTLRDHQNRLIAALDEREAKLAEVQAALEADLLERQTKHAALHDELESKLQAEIDAKKAFLTAQIDAKLADAVSSFLVETLGSNIDLGAQGPYLTSLLERHKDELKQGVRDA